MTLSSCRLLLVVSFALTVAACQSEDKGPQPRFVSSAPDAATASPGAALAAQNRTYFIEFRSRYALSYGHTYVVFGRAGKNGTMINPEVAGLHPASDSEVPYVVGHFVPVPAETGWSDGDLEEKYRSASWRVMLSEPEYREVVAKISQATGILPVLERDLLQLQRVRGRDRAFDGIQGAFQMAASATVHHHTSGNQHEPVVQT